MGSRSLNTSARNLSTPGGLLVGFSKVVVAADVSRRKSLRHHEMRRRTSAATAPHCPATFQPDTTQSPELPLPAGNVKSRVGAGFPSMAFLRMVSGVVSLLLAAIIGFVAFVMFRYETLAVMRREFTGQGIN